MEEDRSSGRQSRPPHREEKKKERKKNLHEFSYGYHCCWSRDGDLAEYACL